ncbi:hypothetical protein OROMI_013368 [Orobanche minor]
MCFSVEKSLVKPDDADYFERWDEPYLKSRESPFSCRDSRACCSSSDLLRPNKSKTNDKAAEPSEVLWVGFPAQLKMDEFVLRKAFSPFGEIEKITAFPGRTYAFVRFRNVLAACRAKETLHGKLFGNPRVHICFAKSESGPSNRERVSVNAPPSLCARSYGDDESFEHFQSDRNFGTGDSSIESPPFIPYLEHGYRNVMDLGRNADLWPGGADARELRRFRGRGSQRGLPGDIYEPLDSPKRNIGAHIRDSSPQNFPRGPIYNDPCDLPEDISRLHGKKKLKTKNMFPLDNDLPEYPFSDLEKAKRIVPREFPYSGVLDKNRDSRHSGYRSIPQNLMKTTQPFQGRGDLWNEFQVGSVQLSSQDHQRQSSSKEVWKWEGMIAKGGTSVCCARCFPVGKPPDMVLPEYLDCTARTSLDMLAKHYYQAAGAWVVFFAPANDTDISYYNEFMDYLGEKQRAAVVKLDERTTLFLVPPSEFSEKVLKVPGKLSISGVVLRLETPGSSYGSIPRNENREASCTSFQGHQKPFSPSGPYLPTQTFAEYEKRCINIAPLRGNLTSGAVCSIANNMHAQGHDYVQKLSPGHDWSDHDFQNLNFVGKNITSQAPIASAGSMGHPYPRLAQEATHISYTPDNISSYTSSGNSKILVPENPQISVAGLPTEQLAHLASTVLGSSSGEYKPSGDINQSVYPSIKTSQNYGLPNEQVSSDIPQLQYGQMQQQSPSLASSQANQQQFQNAGQEDADADPQKRLQATLQLAAALLQQIQQGKGT